MKFRTQVLAGLIAAVAIPAFASAAPYAGLGDIQQRAQLGTTTRIASPDSRAAPSDGEHGSRYLDLAKLQQLGQMGRGTGGSEGAPAEFFTEHQRVMNEGVSHIEASQVAARKLGTNQN